MGFFITQGSESSLISAVERHTLQAQETEACGKEGCTVKADWQKFKKDPTYDNYMRAHRVRNAKMEAKAPPGFKDTVKHMKEHKEVDNPHALAWYMHEKREVKAKIDAPSDLAKSKAVTPSKNGEIIKVKKTKKAVPDHNKKFSAGGPGSGRHAGTALLEKPEEKLQTKADLASHSLLQMGFKEDMRHARQNGERVFNLLKKEGLDLPGGGASKWHTEHSVMVRPDGTWTHTSEALHEGQDVRSLSALNLKAGKQETEGRYVSLLLMHLKEVLK